MTAPRRIVLLTPDLFFETRIRTAAAHLGVDITLATAATFVADCHDAARALVDLHAPGAIDAIRAAKADPATGHLRITGFYSHVDATTRDAALAAHVDEAMPRSVFTQRLAALLER